MNEAIEMKAAVLSAVGGQLQIKSVAQPIPRDHEVKIRVHCAAVLPHQRLAFSGQGPFLLPKLPAVMGWDSTGEVTEIGADVSSIAVGDRVYLYPVMTCGQCDRCRRGSPLVCESFMLQGGFGLSPKSAKLQEHYRSGAFAEYQCAPSKNAIVLPDQFRFSDGVRFGYAGVSYRALKRGGVSAGKTVLLNGATGNLGVLATHLAIALGADHVFAVARSEDKLTRLVESCPSGRVTAIALNSSDPLPQELRRQCNGQGVDVVVDFLDSSAGGTASAVESTLKCLNPEGTLVVVGAIFDPISVSYMQLVTQDCNIVGSHGFTLQDAHELASMFRSGACGFPDYDEQSFSLDRSEEALDAAWSRPGGLTNVVICPNE